MILLIDMGNQRLKWCCVETEARSFTEGMTQCLAASNEAVSIDDLSICADDSWRSQLPWSGPQPAEIWISAVSQNDAAEQVKHRCLLQWGVAPVFMDSPAHFGALQNGYDRPAQLGVDRWLAALGAWSLTRAEEGGTNLVVIDTGTAVTVDAVVGSTFLGGAILPGLALIADLLGTRTGRIRLEQPPLANGVGQSHDNAMSASMTGLLHQGFATNSDDAVRAGAVAAVLGGVRYCVDSAIAEIAAEGNAGDSPVALFLCGGDGALVAAGLEEAGAGQWTLRLVPNLVLAGLYVTACDEKRGEAGQ